MRLNNILSNTHIAPFYNLFTVANELVGKIDAGLCLLVGLTHEDTEKDLEEMYSDWKHLLYLINFFSATKILKLKLFSLPEEEARWKFSVKDAPFPLGILAVSQFTLYARTDKGSKPDFHLAMPGEAALQLFNKFVEMLRDRLGRGPEAVQTGAFGKYMNVEICNDGPVTILLESKK